MEKVPRIQIADDPAQLAHAAAGFFLGIVKTAVSRRGCSFVALSGGKSPRGMYRCLVESPYRESVPWTHLHLFWVDERCVPHTDGASNFGAARENFLKTLPIPPAQVHPMPTDPGSEDAASAYETALKKTGALIWDGLPCFDLILLGLGTDGHTASLFPGDAGLTEETRWVLPVRGGTPYLDRFTLTFPVLNNADHIVFLVTGADKAPIVKQVLEGGEEPSLPAGRIQPVRGEVTWLLDRQAASHLETKSRIP